jgi:hypothetical protein
VPLGSTGSCSLPEVNAEAARESRREDVTLYTRVYCDACSAKKQLKPLQAESSAARITRRRATENGANATNQAQLRFLQVQTGGELRGGCFSRTRLLSYLDTALAKEGYLLQQSAARKHSTRSLTHARATCRCIIAAPSRPF